MTNNQQAPFPLDGGRAGDGGDRLRHAPAALKHARRLRCDMTQPEKVLWAELRKLDLHFRKQAPLGRYIADFVCHQAKVVVEVDSERHDLPEEQLRDQQRTAWMVGEGYRVLRFRNAEVLDYPERVAEVVQKECAARAPLRKRFRGRTGTPPSPTLPPSRGKGDQVGS